MFKELLLNAALIIASISIGNQILINQEVTPSSPLKIRLFFGLMAGVLGILLMVSSIKVMPGVILDFRHIATLLSATYCGFAASIITGLIIGIFRFSYTADFSYQSILPAFSAIIIGIGCGFISQLKINKLKRWVSMTLLSLVPSCLTMYILINNNFLYIKTLSAYWISASLVSILVYSYIGYIDLSKYTYRKYQQDSFIDHRTGLNNVRQFDNEFNNMINRLTDESLITMLFIDIDFFKKVNDTYGHQNGDKVLEDLGKILLNNSKPTDVVSRNGGEEFSVLMTDCPRDKVQEVAERIRKAVQEHKFHLFDGQIINVTISIGIAIYPETVDEINKIVEKADSALYEAKRTGRNKVVLAK